MNPGQNAPVKISAFDKIPPLSMQQSISVSWGIFPERGDYLFDSYYKSMICLYFNMTINPGQTPSRSKYPPLAKCQNPSSFDVIEH